MGKWLGANGEPTAEPIPEGVHFEEVYEPLDGPDKPHVLKSRRLVRFDPERGELEIVDEWSA